MKKLSRRSAMRAGAAVVGAGMLGESVAADEAKAPKL